MSAHLFQLDGDKGAYCAVAVFRDEAAYRANSEDPVTDRWYSRMRDMLSADPVWRDGDAPSLNFGGI